MGISFPEMMFYAEAEGLLPTRAGKINAVIADIKNYPTPSITHTEFKNILNHYELKYEDLSERELRYLEASVR